jgi:hypothetical protein
VAHGALAAARCLGATRGLLTDKVAAELMLVFRANVLRTLPPAAHALPEFDAEEDEPVLVPQWPHLQLVYELFLRYLESPDFNAADAKAHINQAFVVEVRLGGDGPGGRLPPSFGPAHTTGGPARRAAARAV